jgi:hypothetical protein
MKKIKLTEEQIDYIVTYIEEEDASLIGLLNLVRSLQRWS